MTRQQFTLGELRDVLTRALSVIEESESADEHLELIGELRTLAELTEQAVDGSHMGCARDEVLVCVPTDTWAER